MDLFAKNIGVPFTEIEAFETGVGGSPSNIAIGTSRLGLKSALLTAVGPDEVGKFVIENLKQEGVETQFIQQKPDTRTGMAVVGVQPPDKFPLVFYRENPADVHLTIDDVLNLPLDKAKALLLSGTAMSRGSCRDATLFAAEYGKQQGTTNFIDLDLRPDQWTHGRGFGLNIRTLLPYLDVVIGTEEEFFAALAPDPQTPMSGQSLNESELQALMQHIEDLLKHSHSPETLVLKRGARGVSIFTKSSEPFDVAGYEIEVLNTVGAGDAFASGLIYGFMHGWPWQNCAKMANACGAIVVTRHGCSTAMPIEKEVLAFIDTHGGF